MDSVLFFNHQDTKAQRGFSEISGGLLSVFHRRGAETRRNTEGHSSLCAQSLDSVLFFNHQGTKAQRSFFNRGGAETRRNTGEDSRKLLAQPMCLGDFVVPFLSKQTHREVPSFSSSPKASIGDLFNRCGFIHQRIYQSILRNPLCLCASVVSFFNKPTHSEAPSFSSSPKASIGDLFNRCPIKTLGHNGSFIPTVAGGLL